MRSAAALLLLSVTTSQAAACASASVGHYDFAPGSGARYSGTDVLDYFIGHVESLRLLDPDWQRRSGEPEWQAEIRVLQPYSARNGPLKGTMTFLVPSAGCAGMSLSEGDFAVFATYLKEGRRYIAGWPGPW